MPPLHTSTTMSKTKHPRSKPRPDQRLKIIQQQVGHEQSSTTALYTQVSSDYRQKTLQRMITQRLQTADISYGKTP